MKIARCIQVVIADDHSIVREGLTTVINREPDIKLSRRLAIRRKQSSRSSSIDQELPSSIFTCVE